MRRSTFIRARAVRTGTAVALVAGMLFATRTAAAAPAAPAAITAPAGTRTTIAPGLAGFDTLAAETPAQLACLSAHRYSFDVIDVIGDAWQDEYNAAAAAGMQIVLYQGFDPSTWANPANGTSRGTIIAQKAALARYPKGADIFLNLESDTPAQAPGVTAGELITWVNNWANQVRTAGYVPGVYVGVPQLLNSTNLNSLSRVNFWRSASSSAPQVARGYVMRQTSVPGLPGNPGKTYCGIASGIDIDVAGTDANGAPLIGAAFPRPTPATSVAGAFVPLSPARILDTRNSFGGAGPVSAARPVTLQVTGHGGVPGSGVGAVVMNVTATNPTAAGYITVTPTGSVRPVGAPIVSNLNYVAGQTVPNLVTVELGTGGKVDLKVGPTSSVQIVADVAGYYLAGTASQPGTFTPVTPTRLLDTRNPPSRGPAANGSKTAVQISGATTPGRTLPAAGQVSSAVLNLTATDPGAAGDLRAYAASDSTPPEASNLNFVAGQTVPNLAIAPVAGRHGLDTDGATALYNDSTGSVHLIADLFGYFSAGTASATGAFVQTRPTRILNTQSSVGAARLKADSAAAVQVVGTGPAGNTVPAGATAAVINVTVVNPATPGYVSVFPSDRSAPLASNLNFVKGQVVANLVMVPIGADGKIVLDNQSGGAVDLIGDLAGYFRS